jgi:hypothetical protein
MPNVGLTILIFYDARPKKNIILKNFAIFILVISNFPEKNKYINIKIIKQICE